MKFTQEISIFNPHAIEYAVVSLGTRITQTADEILLEADKKLTNYSTTVEMNSAISQKADQITLEVSETYATIGSVNADIASLSSRITQNATSITAEVTNRVTAVANEATARNTAVANEATARYNADSSLSARITVNATAIESRVEKGSIISTINQSAESVTINASKVNLSGYVTISSLGASGTTTVNGSRIHGGTLILGGNNNENGQISMRNSSGTEIGTWTNSGLTITNPNTLRTSLNTDGQLHVYRYASSQFKEMGTLGKYTITRNGHTYNVIGLNALRENVDGLALVVNGNPYYAINAAQDPHGGMDFTGYGFRHYFDGDTYCEGTYKTACGYGWGGLGDEDDPIVYTAANVRIENWDGFGHFYAASSIRTDGTCSAGYMWSDSSYGGSDERLKENIKNLEISKSKQQIMNLRPVSFNFKKTPDETHHGFIAQEAEKVVDWDFVMDGPEGYKGIAYQDLIADLVAVIQEQEIRIENLERENNG